MNFNITVNQINDYYKININHEGQKMSTGYIVGMVIGFLFFLIIGIIMLVMWLVKNSNNNSINVDIVLSKQNWESELDKNLLIYNFGGDTEKVRSQIISKIRILENSNNQ